MSTHVGEDKAAIKELFLFWGYLEEKEFGNL